LGLTNEKRPYDQNRRYCPVDDASRDTAEHQPGHTRPTMAGYGDSPGVVLRRHLGYGLRGGAEARYRPHLQLGWREPGSHLAQVFLGLVHQIFRSNLHVYLAVAV